MRDDVTTLGEKLTSIEAAVHPHRRAIRLFYTILNVVVVTALTTLPLWWLLLEPEIDGVVIFAVTTLIALWVVILIQKRAMSRGAYGIRRKFHRLLVHDREGFMRDLKLDQKTVIFDGSNLYHFGLAQGVGTRALGSVTRQLRSEGYRVVCFFDANIFYELIKHGDYADGQLHSLAILQDLFGLRGNEIYVVPSGVQADEFILDSLKHLPVSFALTNDQFRDYADLYPTVMKGDQWRKGVVVTGNEIRVLKHRFTTPVYLQ